MASTEDTLPEAESGARASGTAKIVNKLGLHARASAEFVKLASRFEASVTVAKKSGDGLEVNGKSIMGVMMLAGECGSRLVVRAEGPDAEEAVSALVALIERGFDEGDDGRPIVR